MARYYYYIIQRYRVSKCMKMHAKVYSKPPGTSQYTVPHATAFTYTETTTTAILSPLDATRNSLNGNGTGIAPRGIRNCARNNGRTVSPILSLLPFLVRISRWTSSLFLSLFRCGLLLSILKNAANLTRFFCQLRKMVPNSADRPAILKRCTAYSYASTYVRY